jgi:hypothetical protein
MRINARRRQRFPGAPCADVSRPKRKYSRSVEFQNGLKLTILSDKRQFFSILNEYSSKLNRRAKALESRTSGNKLHPVVLIGCQNTERSKSMRKASLALAAAAVVGLTAMAAPAPAEAHWRGGGWGPGLAGGLIAGAVIGGIASNAYAYGPGYGYYGPGYGYGGGYAPAYYGGYAPAYYGGYYGGPYVRRVYRPGYAYYGGPRYYGPRYHRGYYRRW